MVMDVIAIEMLKQVPSCFTNISKEINMKTLLINIDESSINRFVKTNNSWGYKGKPIKWNNSLFTGSISWILAICSNG